MLYTPLSGFLKLAPLSLSQMLLVAAVACVAVLWYELVKVVKKIRQRQTAARATSR